MICMNICARRHILPCFGKFYMRLYLSFSSVIRSCPLQLVSVHIWTRGPIILIWICMVVVGRFCWKISRWKIQFFRRQWRHLILREIHHLFFMNIKLHLQSNSKHIHIKTTCFLSFCEVPLYDRYVYHCTIFKLLSSLPIFGCHFTRHCKNCTGNVLSHFWLAEL